MKYAMVSQRVNVQLQILVSQSSKKFSLLFYKLLLMVVVKKSTLLTHSFTFI